MAERSGYKMWIADGWLFTTECFTMLSVMGIATLLTIVSVLVDAGCAQRPNERVPREINEIACELPPQPLNGHWKLHPSHCGDQVECDVQLGATTLPLKSRILYSCNAGYKLTGNAVVTCNIAGNISSPLGDWLTIPDCTDMRCKVLSTVSVAANCTYQEKEVDCHNPVLLGTRASLWCRAYHFEIDIDGPFNRGNDVICNKNGVWEPEPLRCVRDLTPQIVDVRAANALEFPWHASIYRDDLNQPRKFICGATIIQKNLLITAAHCVYNTTSKGAINANVIYVITGNLRRNFDYPLHKTVKKAEVKNIYIESNYQGFQGNYSSDIAILELVEPFVFALWLFPACVDPSIDDQLVPNENGKVAIFNNTLNDKKEAALHSLKLPYFPYNQCKAASENFEFGQYIAPDTYCAGNTYVTL